MSSPRAWLPAFVPRREHCGGSINYSDSSSELASCELPAPVVPDHAAPRGSRRRSRGAKQPASEWDRLRFCRRSAAPSGEGDCLGSASVSTASTPTATPAQADACPPLPSFLRPAAAASAGATPTYVSPVAEWALTAKNRALTSSILVGDSSSRR
jgi:hypothetical protein